MSFGVYIHIPYCLQKCVYCDFATVETGAKISKIVPPTAYVDRVKKEIAIKGPIIGPREVDTIYFGGGTPSAIAPDLLISIVEALKENGFQPKPNAELTLEINPGTLTDQDVEKLLKYGFNRFSVGVQTFKDRLLKESHRKHSSNDTRNTLKLLQKNKVNYSADILFSLPNQSLEDLSKDLDEISKFSPPHISPYSLTVPEDHLFAKNRAPEEEQVEMFSLIERKLKDMGLDRYEVSNFAKTGFESRHNLIYWDDQEYWGLGMSSHSYLKNYDWGSRFWNTRSIESYVKQIDEISNTKWNFEKHLEADGEVLKEHQSLTDFFHVSLRKHSGLSPKRFEEKFIKPLDSVAGKILTKLVNRGLLERAGENFRLTSNGVLLSNEVFRELTFLA